MSARPTLARLATGLAKLAGAVRGCSGAAVRRGGWALCCGGMISCASAVDLTVTVTGIRNGTGKIAALAFAKADGFPADPKLALAQRVVDAKQGSVTFTFKNLPAGKLAVTVLHDEDANGRLKRNFIGIPVEGVGMSGHPEGKFPPRFADAAVVCRNSRRMSIPLKYW